MKQSDVLAPLLAINVLADITSLEVVRTFEDDHCECAEVNINGINVEFMWHDSVGFLDYYTESQKAFDDLKEAIRVAVAVAKDLED